MKRELKTMEEKLQENPDEVMENGLTRAQNDKIDKEADGIGGILGLISLGLCFYTLYLLFS